MIKQELYDEVLSLEPLCTEICRVIWNNPEISGHEKEASDYFRNLLKNEGFALTECPNMPYAFMAEYGSGSPVIAVLGEYDALPRLSQKVSTEKDPVVAGGPGHACGHNLLGTASAIASIALKKFLETSGTSGTVRFFGCPQEELLDGKVRMIAEHFFDGCDFAISWHPADSNVAHDQGFLASAAMKFFFTGKTAHAAFAPEMGRSALDAVELMNVGVNYLREHVIDRTRIHYTTDSGGFAPNIVPDHASSWYFVRAPKMKNVRETQDRIVKVAKGAAMMTETEVDIQFGYGCCELLESTSFADLMYANLIEADGPKYTPEEMEFAAKVQATVTGPSVEKNRAMYAMPDAALFTGVGARELWKACYQTASSDYGDVSQILPSGMFTTTCWPIGVAPHTWQAGACAGSTIGEKGALYAAKVLAGAGYDLFTKPELGKKIRLEFEMRKDAQYEPMVGDAE